MNWTNSLITDVSYYFLYANIFSSVLQKMNELDKFLDYGRKVLFFVRKYIELGAQENES